MHFNHFLFTEFGCDVSNASGDAYCKPLCLTDQYRTEDLLKVSCDFDEPSKMYFCYCHYNPRKNSQ